MTKVETGLLKRMQVSPKLLYERIEHKNSVQNISIDFKDEELNKKIKYFIGTDILREIRITSDFIEYYLVFPGETTLGAIEHFLNKYFRTEKHKTPLYIVYWCQHKNLRFKCTLSNPSTTNFSEIICTVQLPIENNQMTGA